MIKVRTASTADLKKIAEIYNYYIRNSTATFREEEFSLEEMTEKFNETVKEYPFLTAEDSVDGIVGFAYASCFRTPSAYRLAETTIYLAPQQLNRGLGKDLYYELILETRRRNPRLTGLAACITMENKASIRFHEKMNYLPVGVFRDAGCKFNRFCDVGFWQYSYQKS